MAPRWTAMEDRRLRRLYAAGLPVAEIARGLGRSEDGLVARRRLLELAPRGAPRSWSPLEDRLLGSAGAGSVPARMLAARLGRSPDQVRARRRQLGLTGSQPRRYSTEEDALLRSRWASLEDVPALARQLGRSPDALRLRAKQLGVHRPRGRRRWTPAEDSLVRDGYDAGLTCREIARALPQRTTESVAARARQLGLATYARRWTPAEEAHLLHLLAGRTVAEAAIALGRTPEGIRRRARRLRIGPGAETSSPRARRRWSRDEDELLTLHASLSPARLAAIVGRSDHAVRRRLTVLGLRSGRERSPHHPVARNGALTPGERALVERELRHGGTARLLSLAQRLERPPALIRRLVPTDL